MNQPDYASAPVVVREDLAAAHRQAWQRLAEPGTWWTGAERVAIAAEARHAEACALCRARKAALTPNAVDGAHDSLGILPAPAVEAIHRIRTDPARLSRGWLKGLEAEGLADTHYVELVGVLAVTVAVDTFALALGLAPLPLPEPTTGEPSRRRPGAAVMQQAWVPQIPWDDKTGEAEALYGGGFVANVRRALSLVPDAVRGFFDVMNTHYLPGKKVWDIGQNERAIDRGQMELLAARVSALNQCHY